MCNISTLSCLCVSLSSLSLNIILNDSESTAIHQYYSLNTVCRADIPSLTTPPPNTHTPVSLLCSSGDAETAASFARQLLALGADPNLRSRWTNMRALHYAAYFDVPQLIRVVLQASQPGGESRAAARGERRKVTPTVIAGRTFLFS